MSRKAGLLLPKSVLYPTISFDMMGGLRCGLAATAAGDVEIRTESIGLGADDKLIYAACEKMLFDGATVIAGYVNPLSAEKLEPLFAGANAVFIALDSGYHFPLSTKKLPHIFYLSLNGALCIRTGAALAVGAGHQNMVYTSSFYDSGYRSAFAAHKGIESAGGQVTFNLITPLKRADLTLAPLAAHLESAPRDAIFAAFCGDMLQDFFTAAAASGVLHGHTVYGSSFAGDEQWLAQSPYPGADVRVCVPWATGLATEANAHFMSILKEKKTNINIFSLLGWEAAQVAAHALSLEDAAAGLEGFSFTSARGTVALAADTHLCHAPVYEATVIKDEVTGNCRLVVDRECAIANEQRKALEDDINSITGPMTSWYNAYGCLES